jgi:hypothetical protein
VPSSGLSKSLQQSPEMLLFSLVLHLVGDALDFSAEVRELLDGGSRGK